MPKNLGAACALVALICGNAFGQSPAQNLIRKTAQALGGVERILSIKSLRVEGYGQEAVQNGGGNASASPQAPQRWTNIMSYEETIDVASRRIRIRQRSQAWLPAATLSRVFGNVTTTSVLDGEIPYTINAGTPRRANSGTAASLWIEMETHPVALVRMALDAAATVNNVRTQGRLQLVDITLKRGPKLTLAVDQSTSLPVWVSWMETDGMLRDLTSQKWFTGFEPINGVMMPSGFKTVIDFRNVVQSQMYVTRNFVDAPIDDLSAPQAVKTASAPPAQPPTVDADPVAKGIWLLHGNRGHNSILIEFADHLTMFEVPLDEEWSRALITKARSVVPGKPVTEAIVSHHHFDHSGGVRLAIAEGLRIVAHRGTEDLFREIAARKSTLEPDALSRNPKPLQFVPVDDHLTLKDASMEIEIYHIVGNEHMSEALMAWVPRDRLLIEGDLFDYTWQNYPWGNIYADNVKLRKLDVDKDVPVHGVVMSWKDFLQNVEKMQQTTQQLCKGPEAPLLPQCEVIR